MGVSIWPVVAALLGGVWDAGVQPEVVTQGSVFPSQSYITKHHFNVPQ